MRRTKIVCTLGPTSRTEETLVALIEAGMDVARLNLSHGDHAIHAESIAALRRATARTGRRVAVMIDTKGPEIRVGTFAAGGVTLRAGAPFTLTTRDVPGDETIVGVPYANLPREVKPGGILLLDDGKITLEVLEIAGTDIRCRVLNGGPISDRKKLTAPGARHSLPFLSEQDAEDIRFGVRQGVDFVAASFVRSAADVEAVRGVLREAGGDALVIAKIENCEGVENLEEILAAADGIMVARGDMGVEYPVEEVPLIQKKIIARCRRAGKPVVTATQMLESMIHSPRPTRAEASDVANAILDGTDAVMLSAETASGDYPVEAVRTMARIAERTDEALRNREVAAHPDPEPEHAMTDAISHATCDAAENLGAAAVITATQSGHTARMVAKYRPRVPIVACTPLEHVARRLQLIWGVVPLVIRNRHTTDELINEAILEAVQAGIVSQGDLVVLTAGVPAGVPGSTNLLKIHTVGEILLRGTGVGRRVVKGRARVLADPAGSGARFRDGDILVVRRLEAAHAPLVARALAVIAEEDGTGAGALADHDVAAVLGATGALTLIEDGAVLTVDAPRGLVYRGEARVL